MIRKEITIVVVACKARKALALDFLLDLPHIAHWTTDYDLPSGFRPRPECVAPIPNQTARYRCFKGHQDALTRVQTPYALVLEDDAVPNRNDWVSVANEACGFLDQYELVSLHSREVNENDFVAEAWGKMRFLRPKIQGEAWVLGSLAYLINMEAAPRFIKSVYDGFPRDLANCRHFKFGLIDPSPFNHDRSQGSLIDI
jgi:hypothetical protein